MLLPALILIPFLGIIIIVSYSKYDQFQNIQKIKTIALSITLIDLMLSLIIKVETFYIYQNYNIF